MEITNEIKAKVLAQYLGQKAITTKETYKKPEVGVLSSIDISHLNNGQVTIDSSTGYYLCEPSEMKLFLRDIYDLNIAEDIELCGIIGTIDTRHFLNAIREKRSYQISVSKSFEAHQYLISIGIDLPHYLLNGKTLIEAGLAIDINTLNK